VISPQNLAKQFQPTALQFISSPSAQPSAPGKQVALGPKTPRANKIITTQLIGAPVKREVTEHYDEEESSTPVRRAQHAPKRLTEEIHYHASTTIIRNTPNNTPVSTSTTPVGDDDISLVPNSLRSVVQPVQVTQYVIQQSPVEYQPPNQTWNHYYRQNPQFVEPKEEPQPIQIIEQEIEPQLPEELREYEYEEIPRQTEPTPIQKDEQPQHDEQDVEIDLTPYKSKSSFSLPLEPTITEQLIEQFFNEQIIELDIRLGKQELGTPSMKQLYEIKQKQEEEGKLKKMFGMNSNDVDDEVSQPKKNSSKTRLEIRGKVMEAEIQFLHTKINDLAEEEIAVEASLGRIDTEHFVTETAIAKEEEIRKTIEQINDKIAKSMKDERNQTTEADETTISTMSFNLQKLQEQVTKYSDKLQQLVTSINEQQDKNRREKLEIAHASEMYKARLQFSKKWLADSKQIEAKAQREVEMLRKELEQVKKEEVKTLAMQEYIEREHGRKIVESVERVVNILKGKHDLPGNYISVARAIDMYSTLKEAAQSNQFTVDFFKKFVREHKEFGINIPVFNVENFGDAKKMNYIQEQEEVVFEEEDDDMPDDMLSKLNAINASLQQNQRKELTGKAKKSAAQSEKKKQLEKAKKQNEQAKAFKQMLEQNQQRPKKSSKTTKRR
jgi:hypothetical protein